VKEHPLILGIITSVAPEHYTPETRPRSGAQTRSAAEPQPLHSLDSSNCRINQRISFEGQDYVHLSSIFHVPGPVGHFFSFISHEGHNYTHEVSASEQASATLRREHSGEYLTGKTNFGRKCHSVAHIYAKVVPPMEEDGLDVKTTDIEVVEIVDVDGDDSEVEEGANQEPEFSDDLDSVGPPQHDKMPDVKTPAPPRRSQRNILRPKTDVGKVTSELKKLDFD